jgi:hypothetical protein
MQKREVLAKTPMQKRDNMAKTPMQKREIRTHSHETIRHRQLDQMEKLRKSQTFNPKWCTPSWKNMANERIRKTPV